MRLGLINRPLATIRAALSAPRRIATRLDESDLRFFVARGYVAKRVPLDPALAAAAVDLTWSVLDDRLQRDDPASWRGPVTDCCFTRDLDERRGRVKLKRVVDGHPLLSGLIRDDPVVRGMVRQLLGPTARPRQRLRGLYPTFPQPADRTGPANLDGHPFQLGAILYLTDVAPDGGALSVWPGSHRVMRDAFDSDHEWDWSARYESIRRKAVAASRSLRLPGPAGTLILWHYRLLHRPTVNTRPAVRHALLQDFMHDDFEAKRGAAMASDMWAGWAVAEPVRTRSRGYAAATTLSWT